MGYKVAVVGVTGNVGREMLAILAEREFPADEVVARIKLEQPTGASAVHERMAVTIRPTAIAIRTI